MHMGDALITPAVGGAMWTAAATVTAYCAKKVREDADKSNVPLMGVLGAFVFAAQMLNFTIPGTGSSGHLGGGMILAILLGPYAAFLVMGSVLTVQALFFADGGLLALGANVLNLGFFPAFIAYPLVYRKIVGANPTRRRLFSGSVVAAVVALQFGALGVVLETTLSGISELPFGAFVGVMQPIHLAIGIVEGLATATVILFVQRAQPELLSRVTVGRSLQGLNLKVVFATLAIAAVVFGAALSWLASTNPDGLEWSIARVTGSENLESTDAGARGAGAGVQEKTAFLPEYGFKRAETGGSDIQDADAEEVWPAVDLETTVAGVVGGAITLALAASVGWLLKRRGGSRTHAGA